MEPYHQDIYCKGVWNLNYPLNLTAIPSIYLNICSIIHGLSYFLTAIVHLGVAFIQVLLLQTSLQLLRYKQFFQPKSNRAKMLFSIHKRGGGGEGEFQIHPLHEENSI